MEKLNRELLGEVKQAFVAMPGGADASLGAGPAAGGGMMTQAQAAPMGGTPPMDPAMMGGMDPAMMGGGGGAPMDPAMGGMDPNAMMAGAGVPMGPEGGDPAAMGGDPAAMGMEAPAGQIVLSPQEFVEIITAAMGVAMSGKTSKDAGAEGGAGAPKATGTGAKLDQILAAVAPGAAAGAPAGGMM